MTIMTLILIMDENLRG
jgi:hypothetical protein